LAKASGLVQNRTECPTIHSPNKYAAIPTFSLPDAFSEKAICQKFAKSSSRLTLLWNVATEALSPFDTMMMQVADPRNAPEMLALRESIRAWRFYDHFRTDAHAPARSPQVGTYTPVLCDDGSDIAAAIETI
jgi:hypothetical protein